MMTSKHLGFLRELNQMHFKSWLDRNASKVLSEIGVEIGQRVLDFGCGSGTYSLASAKLVGVKGRVYSMDVSQDELGKVLDKARKQKIRNISTVLSNGNLLPFDQDSFDHVFLIDVLQEITDKEKIFEEAKRVLKKGGLVTVYPMHLDINEVSRIATGSGLELKERKYQLRILVFSKSEK